MLGNSNYARKERAAEFEFHYNVFSLSTNINCAESRNLMLVEIGCTYLIKYKFVHRTRMRTQSHTPAHMPEGHVSQHERFLDCALWGGPAQIYIHIYTY